uniref:Uncharacterized protein n=1 Tax=Acrobeloides nanus TaxID=290746 RepID=A0A914DV00_9BILA
MNRSEAKPKTERCRRSLGKLGGKDAVVGVYSSINADEPLGSEAEDRALQALTRKAGTSAEGARSPVYI